MSEAEASVAAADGGLKNPGYEIFIGLLSILSILNLILLVFLRDSALQYVLTVINIPLTIVFFIDFLYRFKTAPRRGYYFWRNWGWADLLASLPFSTTKILRLFRLIKVYRLLRDYGAKNIAHSLWKDRAGSALYLLLFIAILVLEFGSLQMLRIEQNAQGANITTASDAVWYTIVTISTVGYGDQYPVTNAGRVMGTIIIIVGVGIFGTLTGYLANLFLSPSKDERPSSDESSIASRLAELKALNEKQQEAIERLESQLGGGSR